MPDSIETQIRKAESRLKALHKKLDAKIRKSNAAFNKLPKAQQRVAIAKDVIQQLKAQRLTAKQGVWMDLEVDDPTTLEADTINRAQFDKAFKSAESCRTCALGAAFVCAARLDNKLVDSVEFDFESSDRLKVWDSDVFHALEKFFPLDQLHMMEMAFENGSGACSESDLSVSEKKAKEISAKCFAFGEKYEDDGKRLEAIMKNVIKNGGTFKP